MAEPRPRVLVTDDDPTLRLVLGEALIDEGYDVRTAAHGGQALEVVRGAWVPHLILLDLMMPVMDGRTFRAAQLQLDPHRATIPILVLSAAREAQTVWLEMGAHGCLSKPFDLLVVVATVARLVNGQLARSNEA